MKGFFSTAKIKKSSDGRKFYTCVSCGRYKQAEFPRMKPYGEFKKSILNIGISPDSVDDWNNKPFQGKDGRILRNIYKELGIDLFEDCLNINACFCYSSKLPTNYQIDCCRKNVMKVIEEYQPKVIILLGDAALYSVIGNRWKKNLGTIVKWRGWTIPDRELKCWLCPTYNPMFIRYQEKRNKEITTIWKQDLKQAFSLIDKKLPHYKKPTIEYITNLEKLKEIKSDIIAFDYETTGLKPHAKGHRIICASVADSENHVYTFLMPHTRKEIKPFTDLLKNKYIAKMAHNMKFEDTWTAVRLKTKVDNWGWDSMLAAHILDNRTGVAGLKFQTYVRFGVVDYDSEINPYLQADGTNDNNINKIEEILKSEEMTKKLLKYCALDSIYQFRLAQLQMKEMNYDFLPF